MIFGAGAALFALLALVLPWWLHRRDSHGERRRRVSSIMFMQAAAEPVRARRRVRYLALLALRLALLAALISAFADPRLRVDSAAADARRASPHMVVLDVSLSMGARFEAARDRARGLIAGLPREAPVMLVLAGADIDVAASFGDSRGALNAALASARPGWSRLEFAGLLDRLGVLAGAAAAGPVEVHLVSDFQHSGMPANFNALVSETAGSIAGLALYPVSGAQTNWQLSALRQQDHVVGTVSGSATGERTLSVRLLVVSGVAEGRGAAARQSSAASVRVPANGRASVRLPLPAADAGDLALRVMLDGADVLPADDQAHLVWRRARTQPVPLLTPPDGTQERFLEAALAAGAPAFTLAPADSEGPVAVVLDDVPSAGGLRRLQRHLEQGGHVFMSAGPAMLRSGRVPLLDIDVQGTTSGSRDIRTVDRTHPLAAGAPTWRDVRINRALKLAAASGGQVILALDDGTPLLMEFSAGAGRVVLLTSALDRAWGSLVASAGFVALVQDLFRYLAQDLLPERATAGEPVPVPAGNVQVFDASGARLLNLGDTVGRPGVRIDEPGIYSVRTPQRRVLLAVDPDPRESLLAPAPPQLLARWQDAARRQAPSATGLAAAPRAAADSGSLLPLAPWLLALAALLFLLEAASANLVRPGAAA